MESSLALVLRPLLVHYLSVHYWCIFNIKAIKAALPEILPFLV
jgi:hypothetical protein